MKTYMVKEIFGPTIQGEGSAAGTVVHFVRFAGCNMWDGREDTKAVSRCPFCDTQFRGGSPMTAAQIRLKLVSLGHVENVVLSGGEPGLQVDDALVAELKQDYSLHIESNGSRSLPAHIDHVTISPKILPINQFRITDLKLLYPPIHPELTIENVKDIPAQNYFLQPVMDENYEENVKATIQKLIENPGWRISLQMHKILGVE